MTESQYVLGVSSHFHDSAAVLVHGGRILAAAQEERFTRLKADWRFPNKAIQYCLSQLPTGAALDCVAYFEDPGVKTRRILEQAAMNAPKGARLWPKMVETLGALSDDLPRELLEVAGDPAKITFVPHHRSHAASAFYPSPFDRAAVLVVDGVGEFSTTTIWSGEGHDLTAQSEIRFPHSLGLFYSAFTQYCGFKVNSGEYKLMGLAPFGSKRFERKIRDEVIELRDDGSFALNMTYFDFDKGLSTTSPLFERLMGQGQRMANAAMTPFYMDVAASVQVVLEDAVLGLAKSALKQTGHRNLCMAGGVALNCVANGRLHREVAGLSGLWVQPAAGDAGGALGAALEVSNGAARVQSTPIRPAGDTDGMSQSLLGPRFDDGAIRAALDANNLVYEEVADPDAYANTVAEGLAQGQIIGHFDGRMEFGPRALGNRSILADPRGTDTLSRTNLQIKFREGWRPFAPMVLADQAATYFDEPTNSPYMQLVALLRPDFRGSSTLADARGGGNHTPIDLVKAVQSDFDAVTHVDFSARLQTIEPTGSSRAAAILSAFHARTGCPMLLNTSFNVRGEPIVCSPKDAIECFLNTHLDMLAIGGFLVRRSAQPAAIQGKIGRKRFAAD